MSRTLRESSLHQGGRAFAGFRGHAKIHNTLSL